ncbi:hypothetical protein DMB38_00800 [Streptomyces sp. WAC 06738]|uniref:hypothetical protein n=1 Tax=Streptomyces sp. WAC 06738 TaxID=2203210 RepID=UPI000F6EE978|nr:hypothetical protein [Streptomyces sp. WAC 06738]AZM44540.1 hypothetical protein DMB38_00800 [Streptomyces sp. WAC 06738]
MSTSERPRGTRPRPGRRPRARSRPRTCRATVFASTYAALTYIVPFLAETTGVSGAAVAAFAVAAATRRLAPSTAAEPEGSTLASQHGS